MSNWIPVLSAAQLPFPVSLELVLIAGRAMALVGALATFAWAFSRWRRSMARDTQRVFEQLDLIQGELHGLAEAVAQLAGRLEGMNDRIAATGEPVPAVSSGQAYEQAIRLAQRGLSTEELVARCGLARHEADLLVRLHGRGDPLPRNPAENSQGKQSTDAASRKRLVAVG